VLRALAKYDPDTIAILIPELRTWMAVDPDRYRLPLQDGQSIDEFLHSAVVDDPVPLGAHEAFDAVLAATSPMALSVRADSHAPTHVHERRDEQDRGHLRLLPESELPILALAVSPAWESDLSLMSALRVGIAADGSGEQRPEAEPLDLLRWLLDPEASPPDGLRWFAHGVDLASVPAQHRAFVEAGLPETQMFVSGWVRDPFSIVVGDRAADFALAALYERSYGRCLWMSEESISVVRGNRLLQYEFRNASSGHRRDKNIPISSATLSDQEVEAVIDDLVPRDIRTRIRVVGDPADSEELEEYEEPRNIEVGQPATDALQVLAISDDVAIQISVPVSVSGTGTIETLTPVVVPPPSPLPLAAGQPAWVVDFTVFPQTMPRARGLPADALVAGSDHIVMARAGRSGISYQANNMGFVPAGATIRSRTASPRLRQLGLRDWVAAMCEPHGLEAKHSQPGRHAALLARKLGSRDRLLDLMSSEMPIVLNEFKSTSGSSRDAFPRGDGVVIRGTPYLTFRAFKRLLPDSEGLAAWLDELTVAGLLRRGLALDCDECEALGFVPADALAQRFACSFCGAINELVRARWRTPEEPEWFYDAHNAFRLLLSDNGHVPLFAAARLRSSARRTYSDLAEMELLDTARRGFELDLVALVDDELVVGEAKVTGRLGVGQERADLIAKRFDAATMLRADVVLFATGTTWLVRDKRVVEGVRDARYPRLKVQWMEGLDG
jgi:hypothetical protein